MEWLKLAWEFGGAFGIVSLLLGVAVVHLYRGNQALRDKHEALLTKRAEEKTKMHTDILEAMGERYRRASDRPSRHNIESERPKLRGRYSITNPTNRTRD